MRLFLIYFFYYIGDLISRSTMKWFNGWGYEIYSEAMLISADLDTKNKLWKKPKTKKLNK